MIRLQGNELSELDAQLLAALQVGDKGTAVGLYRSAADLMGQDGHTEAMCFYLTQAYVFALEIGDARVTALHERLMALGREE